jgi:predicted PurR-regulated permease PerM
MSRAVRISPLLVLVSVLVGASIGDWVGGTFGGFVAALLSIPLAGATQVVVREFWRATAPPPPGGAPSGASLGNGEVVERATIVHWETLER